MFRFSLLLLTIIQVSLGYFHPQLNRLQVAYQWKYLDWVKPMIALTGKNFTLGNPLIMDVDVDVPRGRVIVTSPHWLEGTPITLSTISNQYGPGGYLLTPYPNWSWHRSDCDCIISVFRVKIDECNRLWVVDNGSVGRKSVCPAKILIFDLATDTLLHKYIIPEDQAFYGESQFITTAVETVRTCQDAYLYVADVRQRGLLVYSLKKNTSWRWNNTAGNAFGPDEGAADLNIAGETIQLNDGIFGIALSPAGFFNKRYLYFNSLASYHQKFAPTDSLKNASLPEPVIYRSINRRSSQSGAQAISRTGAMFFQLAQRTAIACWNIARPFSPENVVVLAENEETLQYTSGIKVKVTASGREELWLVTNRLQKTIKGTRRSDEVNFRLIKGRVDDLIKGTNCMPPGGKRSEADLDSWRRI